MNALTFNNTALNPVSQSDGQIWLTSADLAKALGYVDAKSVNRILSRNKDEFTNNMTQIVEGVNLTTSSKTKGLTTTTRIFSLRGCHLLAMFSRTKVAKDFRRWVLDILDNEVGVSTVEHEDLPSTVKDRNGLVKAARMAQSRLGIGYDEVFNLIHHRFNISRIGELTVNQVGEATEYIQRLVLDQIAEPYRKSDHAQISDDTSPAIYGNVKPMIENTGEGTKFVGTIGADGRMSMRELQADEFITTMDGIPEVLHMTYPPDPRKLAEIGMKVSQMLINETIHMQQPVAQIVGGGHEC